MTSKKVGEFINGKQIIEVIEPFSTPRHDFDGEYIFDDKSTQKILHFMHQNQSQAEALRTQKEAQLAQKQEEARLAQKQEEARLAQEEAEARLAQEEARLASINTVLKGITFDGNIPKIITEYKKSKTKNEFMEKQILGNKFIISSMLFNDDGTKKFNDDGTKKGGYKRRSHKRRSHKRRSHKRRSHKRRSHKRRSHK